MTSSGLLSAFHLRRPVTPRSSSAPQSIVTQRRGEGEGGRERGELLPPQTFPTHLGVGEVIRIEQWLWMLDVRVGVCVCVRFVYAAIMFCIFISRISLAVYAGIRRDICEILCKLRL